MARPIAVIDCETDPFKPGRFVAPFIWGHFDGVEFRYWEADHTNAFVAFLRERGQVTYAHNGGRFDYIFLKPYIEPGQEIIVINGRVAQFRIGKCEFRDSWNIIPAPLAAYQKTAIDYAIMERGKRYKTDNWRMIIEYLRDDCVYLYHLVKAFTERYGFKLTQASAAMNEWRKMNDGMPIEDSGEDFYQQFAPYYYGGRVQCFAHGIIAAPFKVLDINSAYPFAMLHPHPRGLDYEHTRGYLKHAHFYRLRARSLGALPYRAETGKLTFPADGKVREFSVTGWELQAARDTDCLHGARYVESYRWGELADFGAYVTRFYQERLAARMAQDKIGDLFSKLLMNSLYGKFGANPARYRTYTIVDAAERDALEHDPELEFIGDFGGHVLTGKPLHPLRQRYYNVCTAASVTGFVRAMLWRAIHSCGVGNVLYCDTDSVATRRVDGIALGSKLGEWKDEGDFIRAGIAGRKLYVFTRAKPVKGSRYKLASKGVKLTPRQIYRVAAGHVVNYSPMVPTYSALREPRFTNRKIKATF